MLTRARTVPAVVAFIRVLVASRLRVALVASLLALASLLGSVSAAATPHPAATPVTSTREAQSAECHVYVVTLRVPHVRANARRLGAPGARSAASTTGRRVRTPHGAGIGLSDKLIGLTGLGKYGSKCSGWYLGGELGGMVLGIIQGPAALAKGAAVEGAEATASIYRAVSPAELADIFAIGGFRAGPGAFAAKQFGLTLQETLAFADKMSDVAAIVRAEIPRSTLKALEFSKQIDSFIFKSGVVTAQPGGPMALLNRTLIALEHVF